MKDGETKTTQVRLVAEDGQVTMIFSEQLEWITFSPKNAEKIGQEMLELVKVAKRQIQ